MNRRLKTITLAVMTAILLASAVAQGRPQQNASSRATRQTSAAAQNSGTPGRIAKFTVNRQVGDSNITEDDSGKIGIGTTLPTSQLTVNGVIEMLAGGGIKFADGTVQTTAGLATVTRDATLKGDGTSASPLGLAVPLNLTGAVQPGSVLVVTNTQTFGDGMTVIGGPKGVALRVQGTTSPTFGGIAIIAEGGFSDRISGGRGLIAQGGQSNTGGGGTGVEAFGGFSPNGGGGFGLIAVGGDSRIINRSGGDAIVAFAGDGENGAIDGLAGEFNGNVEVLGTLSKFGGSFKIDHPLDPENKYLSHSFVESPDMKNIYDGVVLLDNNGEAVVEMPEWFEALNRDFRYLLTPIGAPAPTLYIAEKLANNRFKIAGGQPGMEVSWQVTGIRQDAWANKNRIKVEENKSERERGHYLSPEAFGKSEERSVVWANKPELMREIKQRRLGAKQAQQPHQ